MLAGCHAWASTARGLLYPGVGFHLTSFAHYWKESGVKVATVPSGILEVVPTSVACFLEQKLIELKFLGTQHLVL